MSYHPEKQYLDLLDIIMKDGDDRPVRNGHTRAIFGAWMRFDMSKGFPALTTKKLAFNAVKGELIGFIRGVDNAADFRELGVRIWDANANENEQWLNNPNRRGQDDLGRIYGVQWRNWRSVKLVPRKILGIRLPSFRVEIKTIDQLKEVIEGIKNSPFSRRHIVSAWNPGELDQMALPPCHMEFQFFVRSTGHLDLMMKQRSCDMFLGVPFNIASYSLLLHMVAQVTGYEPGEFIHYLGDAHIYHNHFEQVREQLERQPMELPKLWLNPDITDIDDFKPEDIKLVDYEHHPAIRAEMNV
ncbi:MAG: thymidylate synthase [Candidatus Spechtbacterales bacterium]|nr:thymidylate synthase [Candidatus Spechtbacterales bacterium]